MGYLAELEELERTSPEFTLHVDFLGAFTVLGRIDEAVELLERAIEARIGAVVYVRHMNSSTQSEGLTLVLGGRGKTGRRVVQRLASRDVPTRVASRGRESIRPAKSLT